jgi:ABC-type multidrug transport system ATPase subunit
MKALKFENITFGYRKDKSLFKDLSFEITQPVGKGFVIGLMGVSGSGKSTILKLILGIENNYQGEISITPSNPVISYVPQEPVLFEHLTPIENAEYFNRISNYKSKFNRELFKEIAKTLQIEDVLKSATSVNEISGGQRQRISLLRAMSIQPDILLLDEPLTGLDEEVKDQFLQTLATLIQRFSLMVIYVTHHRKEAEFISDVILYLEKDKSVEAVKEAKQTNAKLFFNNPPTVSALNATKEIRVNTLQFRQNGNGIIEPVEATLLSTDSNIRLMSFQEDTIQFSNDFGFEFEVAAETGTYTLLKLKGTQIVFTIDNELFKTKNNSQSKFITLSGNTNLYDNKGKFLQATKIQNNQITR